VWEQPDCQEFEQQFLCHEMPVVVGVASLKRQLFELTRDRATVSERLEQLLEDKHNNNLMPCELYRLYKRVEAQFSTQISSLTARNVELSSELTSLSSKFDDVVSALSARNGLWRLKWKN
jgi:chromosome segregation ATPase